MTWIAQRKNLVAMLFFLLSLRWFLATGIADPAEPRGVSRPGGAWWYRLSWFAFVLAMLSKGSVAPLPFVLLGLIAWYRRPSWADAARLMPYFVVAAALAVVDIWFQRHGAPLFIRTASATERLLGAGTIAWFYLGKTLWPSNLNFVYPLWRVAATNLRWWVPLAGAVLGTIGLWRAQGRWARPARYAVAYFGVMLIPVLGFTDVYFMRYSLVADHYDHLALIGIVAWAAAMATWAASWILSRNGAHGKTVIGGAAAVVILTLGAATWRRNELYRNEETLFTATLAANPQCWLAHVDLGFLAQQQGHFTEALGHYHAALQLAPNSAEAHADLGTLEYAIGRLSEAIAEDRMAIRLRPFYAKTHLNLGNALAAAGQSAAAITEYEIFRAAEPTSAEGAFFEGLAFVQAHRLPEAIACYERAIALRPNYDVAENNLGVALCNASRVADAVPHYSQALQINPGYFEADYNLGIALIDLGRIDDSLFPLQHATKLQPANRTAKSTFGDALYRSGKIDGAAAEFAALIQIDPHDADAHNRLGLCWAAQRRYEQAITEFAAAVRDRPNFAVAQINWGRTLQAAGRIAEASDHLQAAQREPRDGR